MDLYALWVTFRLVTHDFRRWLYSILIFNVLPPRAFAFLQTPPMPDLGSFVDKHGERGVYLWIIAFLSFLLAGAGVVIVALYKKEDSWIKTLERILGEYYSMKEYHARMEERFGRMEGNIEKLLEAAQSWRPRSGR